MEIIKVARTSSGGIAVAPVYCWRPANLCPGTGRLMADEVEAETVRFLTAQKRVKEELGVLAEKNKIFAGHREIAGDSMLRERVLKKIKSECKNAQQALQETIEEVAADFAVMKDAYMKERAADIKDVGKRLLAALQGTSAEDILDLKEDRIVVAKELLPSDMIRMDTAHVKGILTEEGSIASHVCILAKSRNIPILVGVKGILASVEDGVAICMDAAEGMVVIAPDETTREAYWKRQEVYEKEQIALMQLRRTKPVTAGGKRISLCANVGSVEEIRQALPMHIDGVGLFRSEFLFMEKNHFPTEEEQFAVYSEAAELTPGELTIRTLDIGGDKCLPYFPLEKEENPFLGWRGIRISLELEELFKEQIRAVLRAGVFGHVRILLPMLISVTELLRTKKLVEACKEELRERGETYDAHMAVGVMIETPASVLLAEEFAKEADFFSIGTNDLTQYLLAADRENKKTARLCDPMHPAVLRAIRSVIETGHRAQIRVGMCGEMAADADAIPVLLEMGLDEFSMSAGSIDPVRERILTCP